MRRQLFPAFVLGAGTVVIASWLAMAVNARWIADDYCFATAARNGFWQSQAHVYMTAAGRFSVAFFYAVLTRLGPGSAPFLAIGAMLVWLFAAYHVTRSTRLTQAAFAAGFVAAVLQSAPETYQPLVWLGGLLTYGLPVIIGTVLAALVLRGAPVYAPAVLAFIAAGCSEVAAIAQITLAAALAIAAPRRRRTLVAIAIASAIALAIVALAPGNYARRALFEPLPIGEAILRAARATIPAFLGIVRDGYALLLPLALLRAWRTDNPVRPDRQDCLSSIYAAAASLFILFATLAAALAGTGLLPWGRILFVPVAYLVAAGSFGVPPIPRAAVIAICIVAAAGLAVSIPEKLEAVRDASAFAREADRVETAARTTRGALMIPAPRTFGYLEYLARDPSHWTNRCMADYFGTESISAR